MIPRYYICKVSDPPEGPYVAALLDDGLSMLVRVEHPHTALPASSTRMPHLLGTDLISMDHAARLASHGVTHMDTTFQAVMKVAASHPDLEP